MNTPGNGDEEVPVIELEDPITAQSSSETELDNLPTFDMDRIVTKLCSHSTEESVEDAIETLLSERRSSSRSGTSLCLYCSHSSIN